MSSPNNCASRRYGISMLICQLAVITVLNILHISPLCSQHINLFLKLYIPSIMIGETVTLQVVTNQDATKRNISAQLKLIMFSLIAFGIGACSFHIVSILLGASFTDVVEETFLFACLCSALTIFPLFLVNNSNWEEILDCLPEALDVKIYLTDGVRLVTYISLIGAWCGALPIPLDWDRDWQSWPITCCVSAIAGNIVGLGVLILSCTGLFERFSSIKWKTW